MRACLRAIAVVAAAAGLLGCGADADPPETREAPLTGAVPAVSRFVLLAARSIEVGDRAIVSGGALGVAAGGTLVAGADARVGVGQLLLAPRVVLRDRAVTGEIGADSIEAGGASTGPRSPYVAPPPAPQPGPVVGGSEAVTVAIGRTRALAPGKYGAVTVNGRLILDGGLYEVESLRLGPGARLVAARSSTIRMATGLSAAPFASITPAANLRAGDLRLIAAGNIDSAGSSVALAPAVQLTALVVARHTFRSGALLLARGAIAAENVILGWGSHVALDTGFGCGSDAGCDDRNSCTREVCLDGRCARSEAPRGTPCDDGNLCTYRDSCQGGACAPGPPLITEHRSPLPRPQGLVAGPDGLLWYFSAESAPGAADGALARLSPATGMVATIPTRRRVVDLRAGPDGGLWMAGRLPGPGGGLGTLGRITAAGQITGELLGIPADRLAAGPDGNLWFATEVDGSNIAGAIRPADGLITALLFVGNVARSMTAGPDGNVWLALSSAGAAPAAIARITPASGLKEFPVATRGDLNTITAGPDGNLWFTDEGENELGRITPGGVLTKFPVPTVASGLDGLTAGPDGKLWFTERRANRVGWLDPSTGAIVELACIPTAASGPTSIAAGADGKLWFTETAAGNLASLPVPDPR